jgi:ribonuclease Z
MTDDIKLTLLGTGTPTPSHHRAGSSYLLEVGDRVLLFDCGPACVRRLLEANVDVRRITDLFLTHLHYDHCVDYGYLVLTRWDQGVGHIPDLDVYGPAPTANMTELLFGTSGVYGPDLAARTLHPGSDFVVEARGGQLPRQLPQPAVTEVADGSVIEGDGWRLETAEVVHVQPQLTCLAYRLTTASGVSVVFGGDTAPTPKLTQLARDADVLLHMCHLDNNSVTDPRITECCSGHLDAARTARDAGVRTLVLVHITEQMEAVGVRERVLQEVGEIFSGNTIFGEDLLEVPVSAIQTGALR